MNCPQCDEKSSIIGVAPFRVYCKKCLYTATIGDFLNEVGDGSFQIKIESFRTNNTYIVEFGGNTTGTLKVIGASERKMSLFLKVGKPSQCEGFVSFLKEYLGDKLELEMLQTEYDAGFSGCPVCGGGVFKRESPDSECISCAADADHYSVKLHLWAESLVAQAGFVVYSFDTSHFGVSRYRTDSLPWLLGGKGNEFEEIAEIDIRFGDHKTVIAVRSTAPAGLEAKFEKVLSVLQKMKIDGLEVIRIKSKKN